MSVDPSCELESLIVVVEIILKLGRQQEGGQNHLVYVKIAETEVWLLHVVSVDVDDGDNQTFAENWVYLWSLLRKSSSVMLGIDDELKID